MSQKHGHASLWYGRQAGFLTAGCCSMAAHLPEKGCSILKCYRSHHYRARSRRLVMRSLVHCCCKKRDEWIDRTKGYLYTVLRCNCRRWHLQYLSRYTVSSFASEPRFRTSQFSPSNLMGHFSYRGRYLPLTSHIRSTPGPR